MNKRFGKMLHQTTLKSLLIVILISKFLLILALLVINIYGVLLRGQPHHLTCADVKVLLLSTLAVYFLVVESLRRKYSSYLSRTIELLSLEALCIAVLLLLKSIFSAFRIYEMEKTIFEKNTDNESVVRRIFQYEFDADVLLWIALLVEVVVVAILRAYKNQLKTMSLIEHQHRNVFKV